MGVARATPLPTGVVTLLFTDIEGSTKLLHELGDAYGEVLADHHQLLREVWRRHGGVEVDTEGDAFFVAFASAAAALAAAGDAQRRLAGHGWPHGREVRVRMALHTGEPQERDGTYWGIDVHYAARLCSAAHGGQVLLSAATRSLAAGTDVDDLGEHAVKDFAAPRKLFHLVIDGRRADAFPSPRTLEVARTNLPSMTTPLVGRDAELAGLVTRLTDGEERLVTLIGAGGSGKTRLAAAAGSVALDHFADGVFLVALAPLTDGDAVGAALAETVSAPRQAELGAERAIVEHLRELELLLVLDNVEHVLDAAPLLGRLLAQCPRLRILATSQAPLRLAAEAIVPLEPLALPDCADTDPEHLGEVPAVALFLNRARAADPSFALTAANAPAVAQLCRRLDGLPLGLELAAARLRMAGVDGLLAALERGVDALGRGSRDLPERQRGLRAALDWTVSLLDREQRDLFAGLSVFASAWTLEQAEQVFGAELDVWEAMASLLDFSLVQTRGDGRLTMAERVRRHAQELLSESGREAELRAAHADLIAELLEALSPELSLSFGAANARTKDALEEIDQAIAWTARYDPARHRRLLASAGRPLYFVGRLPALAPEIIRLSDAADGSDVESGQLMVTRAMLACLGADMEVVVRWTARAVDCLRRQEAEPQLLNAIQTHAHMLTLAQRPAQARDAVAEGLELAARVGDPRNVHQLEGTLAFADVAEGRYDEAESRLEEMLAHPERDDFASGAAASYLADCAIGRRDGARALPLYIAALERARAGGDAVNACLQLAGIVGALSLLGEDDDAALIDGAARELAAQVGLDWQMLASNTVLYSSLHELELRLGRERQRERAAQGSGRSLEELLELARGKATRLSR